MPGTVSEPMRRVLVVQTAFLGDMVLTLPLLRELRRVLPRAELCLLTTQTGRALVAGGSDVDRCLVLHKGWDRAGRRSFRELRRELMRERYDAAVAAHRSVRSGILVRLSGAPLRVGFAGAPGSWACNRRIPWDPERHAVERYLALAEPLGGDPRSADPQPRLVVDGAADRRVRRLLERVGIAADAPVLCVAPGSLWATKRWSPEGFARVVAAAPDRGMRPVLIGAAEDRALCRRVAALAPAPVLAGETTIPELAALVARARMVVANDSGAAHVASAVGTPVVSVFGSTTPALGYAPFGEDTRVVEHPHLACRPCGRHGQRSCPAGHFRCMTELAASSVLARLDDLLSATAPLAGPAPAPLLRLVERRAVGAQTPPVVAPG